MSEGLRLVSHYLVLLVALRTGSAQVDSRAVLLWCQLFVDLGTSSVGDSIEVPWFFVELYFQVSRHPSENDIRHSFWTFLVNVLCDIVVVV